ncbi:hypothetical protein [Rossellomorea aquimaris]|jgi:hypothetical protein|uniref:hypothetical protein n=1 Tax=Rossellomorea aquimaris TaxID=189382 RepID=UPI0011E980B0|nr:hypothetical protein [Rossellomorea aquimaris]TYS90214.1 hypothetical protein FZC88_11655 [Rossellomorea aquimaris]
MGVVIWDGAWVKMEGTGTLVVGSVFLLTSIIFILSSGYNRHYSDRLKEDGMDLVGKEGEFRH